MITLKQFTGQTITPTDDAALYDFFSSRQSGIIDGCQVTSLGDNRLQVSAGRGIIRGRSFVVEQEEIRAQLGTAENQKGRLSIKIDLGNTGTPISFVTAAGETLDNPIQQDINHGGSVFELPLAEYTVGATQITNLKNVAIQLVMASPVSMEMGEYSGTGTASRTIELGYKPTLVRIFTVGEPPIAAVSTLGETQIYSAIATQAGASKGLSLTDTGFKVLQSGSSTPDGKRNMLNQSEKRYIYLTIRQGGVTDSPIIPERPTEEFAELKNISLGAKVKIPELAGFEENPFVVVAKNHPTHAANTVCLMMSKPYKTGAFYNTEGRTPYYEISELKADAEALYSKMPQGLKSRIIKTKTKAQIVNGASDIEGCVLPPTASEIKGGDASGFVAEELKVNKQFAYFQNQMERSGEEFWTVSVPDSSSSYDVLELLANRSLQGKICTKTSGYRYYFVISDDVMYSTKPNADGSYTLQV